MSLTGNGKGPHWTIYVGIVLGVIGFGWQLAGAWFDMQHRIRDLEKEQFYQHGDVKSFLKD